MTVPTDPYDFSNGDVADGDQVDARFLPLYSALDGGLDVDNLLPAVKAKLGLSDGTVVRRGKSIVAGAETRASSAYGLLATPDRVQNLVLPTDGLIFLVFNALWKCSVVNGGVASIFLGANQLKHRIDGAGAPAVMQAQHSNGFADRYNPLITSPDRGLVTMTGSNTDASADVTTGQLVGGFGVTSTFEWGGGVAVIQAAAGTYDVSVQFKALAGTVTVQNRKLWVWTGAF